MLIVVIWRHLVKRHGQGKARQRQLAGIGRKAAAVSYRRRGWHCWPLTTAAAQRFAG